MAKIYIGGDHTGFFIKQKLIEYLKDFGHDIEDRGPFAHNPDDDYPDFVTNVAESVADENGSFGILLGGSGQGEAMCANRIKGARAAVFYGEVSPVDAVDANGSKSSDPFEIVMLERKHNDANILSLGVRFLTFDEIKFATEIFLSTPFSGEERHVRRLSKF